MRAPGGSGFIELISYLLRVLRVVPSGSDAVSIGATSLSTEWPSYELGCSTCRIPPDPTAANRRRIIDIEVFEEPAAAVVSQVDAAFHSVRYSVCNASKIDGATVVGRVESSALPRSFDGQVSVFMHVLSLP